MALVGAARGTQVEGPEFPLGAPRGVPSTSGWEWLLPGAEAAVRLEFIERKSR